MAGGPVEEPIVSAAAGHGAAFDPAALLAELAGLKRRLAEQEARAERQAAELDGLRRAVGLPGEAGDARDGPLPAGNGAARPKAGPRASRRRAFGRAVAALATFGLAGAAGSRGAEAKPAALTGDNMKVGQLNRPTSINDVTQLLNPIGMGGSAAHNLLFQADNVPSGSTSFLSGQKISIAGTNNFTGTAVLSGAEHIGVYGRAPGGQGVVAEGFWPLRIVPRTSTPTPPSVDTGGNAAKPGMLFYQDAVFDSLWVHFDQVFGVGDPRNWRRIASQNAAGVFVLSLPTRVLDTRPSQGSIVTTGFDAAGAPIAAGQLPAGDVTRTYRLAGNFSLPAVGELRGVLFNLTRVQTVAGGGFTTVFSPSVSPPNASNVNPVTPVAFNFGAVATNVSGADAGNIAIRSVGDQPHDLVMDVFGYFW